MPAADPLVAPEPMVVAEPMPAIAGALVGVPTDGRLATDSGIGMARIAEEVVAWLKTLASAAVYATLIVTFGFQVARVEGQSMAPTLADQDRLIVNKLAYRIGEPHVGDIVMLYYPLNPDKSFVKRVIAEEGDQVRDRRRPRLPQRRADGRRRSCRASTAVTTTGARRSCPRATTS